MFVRFFFTKCFFVGAVLFFLLTVYMQGAVAASGCDPTDSNTYTKPVDGLGTEGNPYQISTVEHLCWLSQGDNGTTSDTERWNKHYKLMNDIDAGATSGWNSSAGFSPVGNDVTEFTGSFDGDGHKITGLFIDRPSSLYVGFLGYVGAGGEIRNLVFENATITGGSYVGTLAGFSEGLLEHVHVTGTSSVTGTSFVSGNSALGGLVGFVRSSTVQKVSSNASVTAQGSGNIFAGGLVGGCDAGYVVESHASGNVIYSETSSRNVYLGGLIGKGNGDIRKSYAGGDISCTGSGSGKLAVGGLVGFHVNGNILMSYSTGGVLATEGYTGGLVGQSGEGFSEGADEFIINSYATGQVSAGTGAAGGLVALNTRPLVNSYATGAVSGSTTGGLVALQGNYGNITDSFWDTDTTGQTFGVGMVIIGGSIGTPYGKSTSEMQSKATYDAVNWDIALAADAVSEGAIWSIDDGNEYPRLNFAPLPAGSCKLAHTVPQAPPQNESSSIYEISTLEQLCWLSEGDNGKTTDFERWSADYKLLNNIDAGSTATWNDGAGFSPVGRVNPFIGSFDGAGYKITGLSINRPNEDFVGFFGFISYEYDSSPARIPDTGVVKNLGLENAAIIGGRNVGGMVGVSQGMVEKSFTSGSVTGRENVGGLVGYNEEPGAGETAGIVSESYSTSAVRGENTDSGAMQNVVAGGLVGLNAAGIEKSYATGAVTAESAALSAVAGGLVGINTESTGVVKNSYATGGVTVTAAIDGRIGGVAGINRADASIENTYATGNVDGTAAGQFSKGGLVGYNDAAGLSASYWNPETTGLDEGIGADAGGTVSVEYDTGGAHGKTTAQMRDINTFDGWNINTIEEGADEIWYTDGFNPPYLSWQDPSLFAGCTSSWSEAPVGSGTEEDPYAIASVQDLCWVSQGAGRVYRDKYFLLTEDIDARGTYVWNGGAGFSPIGDSSTAFTGTFDGDGYKVTGLSLTSGGTDTGFMGVLGTGGRVLKLVLEDVDIDGTDRTGGLAGTNNGTIQVSFVTGSVTGSTQVGGLVGLNTGFIHNVYSVVQVNGTAQVGGVAGENTGNITNTYAVLEVLGALDTGGLVGKNSSGTVEDSYWQTGLTGTNQARGIGADTSGTVPTEYDTGGTHGKDAAAMQSADTYSTWDIGATEQEALDDNLVWWMGALYPRLNFSVFLPPPSDKPVAVEPALKDGVYEISIIEHLLWLSEGDGGLTSDADRWDKKYKLTADIDASGTAGWNNGAGFSPVGKSGVRFTGSFDGDGYEISGLVINRPGEDYVGFFGRVAGSAAVTGLGLSDVNITGSNYTGALGGHIGPYTLVERSYVTGSVKGQNFVGGFVGEANGFMDAVSASGTVMGDETVGGFAGKATGEITNAFAAGSTSANRQVGGFIGLSSATVKCAYAIGLVIGSIDSGAGFIAENSGRVVVSFWNTETAGVDKGILVDNALDTDLVGSTTAEMHDINTYINADWSISSEGEDAIWGIQNSYPYLTFSPDGGSSGGGGDGGGGVTGGGSGSSGCSLGTGRDHALFLFILLLSGFSLVRFFRKHQ